ncbi:MAG: hypothetical protein V2J08_15025 [Desulfotignum sp.]|jgi:hypothetical protein|nr:hypothetical protein [Desulfotignum sp.]
MAKTHPKRWLALLFIALCLAIPFGIIYYISTQNFQEHHENSQPASEFARAESVSRAADDRLVLTLGERVAVANTALVYKGLVSGQICLDLYLLDLDSEHPYQQRFSADTGDVPIRMGDITYSVVSANDQVVVLKILHIMQTN